MLESSRPAWLHERRADRIEDDQEAALLPEEEKDLQDEALDDPIPKRSFSYRLANHLRLDDDQVQNFKPAWLRPRKERKIHPTSYLDGLRGVASFLVFIHHSSLAFFPEIRLGYGSPPGGSYAVNHNYIIQLPILRIVYSGAAMVTIFFVISGYVLSTKPLRLAREGQHQKLYAGLASSTFRRGPRLFIPCLVATFVTAVFSMLGFMLDSGITRHYPKSATGSWFEQLSTWAQDMIQFVSPFAGGTMFEQNLWTIPIEFRGSLMVFLCGLGFSSLRSKVMRTCMIFLVTGYWLYMGYWELFLFAGGMVVAECALYRSKPANHKLAMRIFYAFMMLFCVYLLSMPEEGEGADASWFGFSFFENYLTPVHWHAHAPPGRWWVDLAAVMLVGTLEHAGPTSLYQRLFTSRFAQYLGEISFSFYLWHGLTIFTVGARMMTFMLSIMGGQGFGWWVSLIATYMTVLPILFWVSDLSTVFVDRAAVNFAKRLMEL